MKYQLGKALLNSVLITLLLLFVSNLLHPLKAAPLADTLIHQQSAKPLHKSLASRLLAEALTAKRVAAPATPEFRWESQAMSANVNLADKEAVYRALDGR